MIKTVLVLTLVLATFAIGCGGASVLTRPEGTPELEPIRVRTEIVDLLTADDLPTAITIELEDGSRLLLRLDDAIDLDVWGFTHLDGHRRTNTTLFVTYEERPDEFVAIELSD